MIVIGPRRPKVRGYRWNGAATAQSPRAWYTDVAEKRRKAELRFLEQEIYGRLVDLPTRRITVRDRFSEAVTLRQNAIPLTPGSRHGRSHP
ncbi:MAG TPA: hypothetical protein VNZ61_26115 [Roseomonas sp.]|nr:hypothetical protein [Roseomonas sp.]